MLQIFLAESFYSGGRRLNLHGRYWLVLETPLFSIIGGAVTLTPYTWLIVRSLLPKGHVQCVGKLPPSVLKLDILQQGQERPPRLGSTSFP